MMNEIYRFDETMAYGKIELQFSLRGSRFTETLET